MDTLQMRMRSVLLTMALLPVSLPTMADNVPFSVEDFASYAGDGPASLEGEAFTKTKGGQSRTCIGETVFLIPANKFDLTVINKFAFATLSARNLAGPALPYWREATCDSQGKFAFTNVPTGTWIVYTEIKWETGDSFERVNSIKKAVLRAGPNRIIVGPQDRKFLFGDWELN